jgi:hypothetical protein
MRARAVRLAVAFLASAAGAFAAPASSPVFGNAPYDATPPKSGRVSIRVDLSAAEQILEVLSADKLKPGAASELQALSAVRRQISDSGKSAAEWDGDIAAAFLPESRPATFDFRSVRLDRDRWNVAIAAVRLDRDEIARSAARRVEALLPSDVALEFSAEVNVTFALAGIEDHVLFPVGDRKIVILVDLGRALAENAGTSRADASETLSRLAAADTFRGAWELYRRLSPGWQKPPGGPIDPLARAVSTVAPITLFAFDKNFFPLSRWLHDDMLRTIDALNQEAAVLADPKADLGKRAELLTALRKPGLRAHPALAAGAFLADGIFQALGQRALLDALAAGPTGLFSAYEAASDTKKSGLPPLSSKLREALKRK